MTIEQIINNITDPEVSDILACITDCLLENNYGEDGQAEKDLIKIITYFTH